MRQKRAARHSCNYARARASTRRDSSIIQYDRATRWAGLLIGLSFGVMFAIGAWLGW